VRVRKLGLVLLVLVFPSGALAAKPHAVARTLVVSGPVDKAGDWSPEGKPGPGDDLTVPAGKTAEVRARLQAGSLLVEGELTGNQTIEASGSVTFDHQVGWHETLISTGIDQLNLGGTTVASVVDHGIISLRGPLSVSGNLEWENSSLDTNGWPVSVRGIAYPLEGSYSGYGDSTVTAGEWLDYHFEQEPNEWVYQLSEEATVIVDGSVTTFKGGGWYYGNVTLAGRISTFSGDSYGVDGTLALDSPVVTIEDGQAVDVEGLITSDATAAHPVRVQAGTILGGPGGQASIEYAGSLPPYVELVGVRVL